MRRLCPDASFQFRERLSQLSYDGPRKLTRLPRRSAVVAFSADAVYAIAELIRRHRGGAAVVMGSLEPAHPQRAGRALPVRRGRLSGRDRRDRHGPQHGRRPCRLRRPAQVRRTAHARALRPGDRPDRRAAPGAFARTAPSASPAMRPTSTPTSSAAVEGHVFPSVEAAEWRNARLDFQSLQGLMRSLAAPAADGPAAAFRGSPGRDDAAPALDRRDRRSPRARPRQSHAPVGGLPDARTSARRRRRSIRG